MRYRRHETLRYSFQDPPSARYKIIRVDGKQVNSSTGNGHIIDISPGGMKLATSVQIPLQKQVQLFVQTKIADVDLSFTADVIWTKPFKKDHHYGLDFIGDHHEEVVQALKKLRNISSS